MLVETLPTYNHEDNRPIDGIYFPVPVYCKKHYKDICKVHYQDISKKEGFHICPYGFTTYVKYIGSDIVIYTGLRVKNHCLVKKINPKIKNDNCPIMNENEFIRQLKISESYSTEFIKMLAFSKSAGEKLSNLEERIAIITKFISNTLHEVRKLNTVIKQQVEDLIYHLQKEDKLNIEFINYRIANLFATSSLITTRLNSFDILVNPDLVTNGVKKEVRIYDKFHKTRHCLDTYFKKNHLNVNISGTSYSNIMAFDIIEILPFLIYENAIKYSPENSDINVFFNDNDDFINIQIESYGPMILEEEKEKVFINDFRGRNATLVSKSGTGVGLYLAKIICDIHNAKISIHSKQEKTKINNIDYSLCYINLSFPKSI